LNYILTYQDSTISIMRIMCRCEKISYNLTIRSYMIIQNRGVRSYLDLGVRSDVKLQGRRFSLCFFVWPYVIRHDISVRSDTNLQESVIHLSIWFFLPGKLSYYTNLIWSFKIVLVDHTCILLSVLM